MVREQMKKQLGHISKSVCLLLTLFEDCVENFFFSWKLCEHCQNNLQVDLHIQTKIWSVFEKKLVKIFFYKNTRVVYSLLLGQDMD